MLSKHFAFSLILFSEYLILGTVTKKLEEFPGSVQLYSNIALGHFAKSGIYKLDNSDIPTYVNENDCKIVKIQSSDSCGTENCKDLCFHRDCYEASCPDTENIPPTIFMNCQQGGPQTCSRAEYISYEDFEHGMRIMNTTDFTLNEISDNDPIELLEENKKLVKTYKAIWIIVVVIVFLLLLLVIDLIWFQFALRAMKTFSRSRLGRCFRSNRPRSHQGFGPIEEEEMDHILGPHAYSFDVRKSSDGNIEEQDWVKVIRTTFDITLDQLARKRAFDTTLSNTLNVGGYYQEWLTKNGGANANRDLFDKVEEILRLWNDHSQSGKGSRNELVQALSQNQQANSCNPLIHVLQKNIPGSSADEEAKSIDMPPQCDTTSIQGNERHRRKITRRVSQARFNSPEPVKLSRKRSISDHERPKSMYF